LNLPTYQPTAIQNFFYTIHQQLRQQVRRLIRIATILYIWYIGTMLNAYYNILQVKSHNGAIIIVTCLCPRDSLIITIQQYCIMYATKPRITPKTKSSRFVIFHDLSHWKFFIFGHSYTYRRFAYNCTKLYGNRNSFPPASGPCVSFSTHIIYMYLICFRQFMAIVEIIKRVTVVDWRWLCFHSIRYVPIHDIIL